MFLKQYYGSLFIAQTLMVLLGATNLYYIENVEPTILNKGLLYSMLSVVATYFIGDLLYMITFYNKQYKSYIIHHILFATISYLTLIHTGFQFTRYMFSIAMLSESSSVILDIEALYKLYKNPNADPMKYAETGTKFLVFTKALFFVVFLSVRYGLVPYLTVQMLSMDWSVNEYRMIVVNSATYGVMHIFWFYKLVMYVIKKCKNTNKVATD
jgi:hypothetical protein